MEGICVHRGVNYVCVIRYQLIGGSESRRCYLMAKKLGVVLCSASGNIEGVKHTLCGSWNMKGVGCNSSLGGSWNEYIYWV